ncbi:hypothetical protein JOQ06_006770, partial [Pogonophryne albipinna]
MQVDRSCVVSSAWCACLILLFSTLGTRVSEVGGTHQSIPPSVVKLWASAFGGEIKSISAKYSGSQLLQKKYKEFERAVRVDEIDGLRLVKRLADDMEEMFHKKAQAMKENIQIQATALPCSWWREFAERLVEAAEEAHLQHEEDPDLQ